MTMIPFAGILALFAFTAPTQQPIKNETPPPQPNTSIEQYNNLISWLESFPTAYVLPSLRIAPSDRGGYGAFATESIPKGTKLYSIPREACITSDVVLGDEDCGEIFQELMKKAGPGSFTVALSGYLAKEFLKGKAGSETKYGPYLDTLPWKRGWNGQEHILFWSEEDISLYLKESLCYKESTDLRAEVKIAKRVLNSLVGPPILKARGIEEKPLIPFLPFTKPPPPTSPIPGLGDAVTAAFAIALSRSFSDDFGNEIDLGDDEAERLIPVFDLLNHDNNPSIRHNTLSDGSVEVTAGRDIASGEELYNRYKEEEEVNMPNHRFFSRFGFVPGITDDIQTLFTDKSSIFFAKKAEV